MALREILPNDDARLRERSVEVDWREGSEQVRALCEDLRHTMLHGARAAIGLAAPQIGVLKRVFVMAELLAGGRFKVHVCINPEIRDRRGSMRLREGCLSFAEDEYVEVERAAEVELVYADHTGRQRSRRFQGIMAVCAQHELDHLDGKLMSDHGAVERRGEDHQ